MHIEGVAWQMEPPLLEQLTSTIWSHLESTPFWVPRVICLLLWLVGGLFLWTCTRSLLSRPAAFFALSFYYLFPYGIVMSRSFMVDSLMMCAYFAALHSLVRWHHHPSRGHFYMMLVTGSLAALVKPGFLSLSLIGAFIGLQPFSRIFEQKKAACFYLASLLLLPAAYILLFISYMTKNRFYPDLLGTIDFWKGWFLQLHTVYGPWILILSFIGLLLTRKKLQRFILTLVGSYIVFGLLNTDLFRRIDHYHLILLPVVALCLGQLGETLFENFKEKKIFSPKTLICLLLCALGLSLREGRLRLIHPAPEIQKASLKEQPLDMREEIQLYADIGKLVNHSQDCLFLAPSYGIPLMFHGNLFGRPWLTTADHHFLEIDGQKPKEAPITTRLAQQVKVNTDYFIVTDLREWSRQLDLKNHLLSNYAIHAQSSRYIIFNLRKPHSRD